MSGGGYLRDKKGNLIHYTDEELAERGRSNTVIYALVMVLGGAAFMYVSFTDDEFVFGDSNSGAFIVFCISSFIFLLGAIALMAFSSKGEVMKYLITLAIVGGIIGFGLYCCRGSDDKKKENKTEQVAQAPTSTNIQSNEASFKAEESNETVEEYDGDVYEEEEVEDNYSSNETAMNEESSNTERSETHEVVETMPTFPGGNEALMKYLSDNVKVPPYAEENGIQGKVVVSYVIDFDGSVTDVQVVQSVHPVLDNEAMRVVKNMPKWTAGTRNGMAVRTKYSVPINFYFQ